ncbi:hypothetical protein [Chryseolinea soli]|uniref:Beta-lactamase-inhibitor-like PepSY-like domain-containing protein n=1 Tax=Chryseolinea soli TaxID=2321403 RepID=A0A385SY51_9BACT|nr:hypothetical protein [Chryseolinea soli]AYB35027.1 hypothetical protein D4L85_32565 [Chryseolinea soli]
MKKIMLIAAGALLFSITATYAQNDTTGTKRNATPPAASPQPSPTQQPQPAATPQPGQNYQKDMTPIKPADIPSGMRQTLQDPQYKGWENSPIYKSNSNDGYILQMNTGGQPQSYHFDSEGKLVPNPKP